MADIGHGCDEGQTAESSPGTTGTIRRVPRNLLGILMSRITHYLERGEDISAEIHENPGQSAKLVLSLIGAKDVSNPKSEATDCVLEDTVTTNKILVKNLPSAIDEDILEVFFESEKKTGGGPVKNVQLNKQKDWAIVEFYEADVVKGVMSQVPITIMATELDICPYTPLLQGEGFLESLAIHNLPKELTDVLLTMHIEGAFEATEISSAEYLSDGGEEDLKNADLAIERPIYTQRYPKTKGFVKETITCLQPVQLKMLQMTNYTETVLEKLQEIKVELDLEKNEISFLGDARTVLSGYKNLLETLSKLGLNRIQKTMVEHIGLYKRGKVIGYIDSKLKAQNFVCAWEVSKQELVICSQEEQIAACTKLIDEAITEIKFPISKESSATVITQEWEKESKNILEEKEFVLSVFSDKTSTIITVIATDKEISDIVSHIKEFLKGQLEMTREAFRREENLSAKFKRLYDVDLLLAYNVLELIEEGLSLYHVRISHDNRWDCKYYITGTRKGVELVKKRITQLDISF